MHEQLIKILKVILLFKCNVNKSDGTVLVFHCLSERMLGEASRLSAVLSMTVMVVGVSQLVPLLSLTDARRPLAVHVRPAAQSPHCVVQGVCHRFTRWQEKHTAWFRRSREQPEHLRSGGHLTLNLGDEAQTLLEIGAEGVQTDPKLGVAVVLVHPTGVITGIQLIAAFGHSRDPNIKLPNQKRRRC